MRPLRHKPPIPPTGVFRDMSGFPKTSPPVIKRLVEGNIELNKQKYPRDQALYKAEELRPWMKTYASWLAAHDLLKLPKVADRIKKVQGMMRGRISREGLNCLEKRQDFQNLVQELTRDERRRARLHMEIYATDMIDIHKQATEGLMAEGKFDKIAPLTTPYLDRIWPKVDENQQQAQVIQIHLGDSYAKGQVASLEDASEPSVEAVEVFEETESDDLS